jgi:hypothetical protein
MTNSQSPIDNHSTLTVVPLAPVVPDALNVPDVSSRHGFVAHDGSTRR